MNSSSMGKWLAGIIAAVVSGVVVFYLTEGWRSSSVSVGPQSPPHNSSQTANEPTPSPPQVPNEPEQSVDIGGNWEGVIYQTLPNGVLAPYGYGLTLSQSGNSVEGNSTIQAPAPYGYSAVMKLRGSILDKVFSYDDVQIVSTVAPQGWLWCQKAVKLTYDQDNNVLQGTWAQPGCGSGTVNLSR